jgi:hypothetical protein
MSMLRELEKLLREVAEQQGLGPPAKKAAGSQRRRPPPARPVEAEILDEDDLEVLSDPKADIASRRLDTSDVTGNTSQLGYQVGQSDERLEARLHQKFDHDLTSLDDRETTKSAPPGSAKKPSVAASIADMLKEPDSIRNAVILSEILTRPEHRW